MASELSAALAADLRKRAMAVEGPLRAALLSLAHKLDNGPQFTPDVQRMVRPDGVRMVRQ